MKLLLEIKEKTLERLQRDNSNLFEYKHLKTIQDFNDDASKLLFMLDGQGTYLKKMGNNLVLTGKT